MRVRTVVLKPGFSLFLLVFEPCIGLSRRGRPLTLSRENWIPKERNYCTIKKIKLFSNFIFSSFFAEVFPMVFPRKGGVFPRISWWIGG
jgi:hypothetical protein